MKYENLKSIVLTLLVLTSGVLTWSIWTYQPKEEKALVQVHKVTVSEQEDTVELIKPLRIIYHSEDAHYGTVLNQPIENVMASMNKWDFQDIKRVKMLNDKQLKEAIHSNNRIVISYPDIVPFDLFRGIIQIETEYPNASFNHIVIDLADDSEKTATIAFINSEEGRLYESYVEVEKAEKLRETLNLEEFEAYESYVLSNDKEFFIPASSTELVEYRYLPDRIEPAKFKNALFSDPSLVRGDEFAAGEQYTDGKSMMKANSRNQTLIYINPRQEPDGERNYESDEHIIRRSIDFVNEHSGWTDDYRYFSLGEYQNRTSFRLFYQGRPVFNDNDMAEIRQYWGPEEIYKYERPYFRLDVAIPNTRNVTLISGKKALNRLFANRELNIDPNQLEDVLIGYSLSWDNGLSDVLVLTPSWYYLYAGSWLKVPMSEKGEK